MIKYYYKSLRTAAVQEPKEAKRGSWIYVETPSHKELEMLAATYALELDLLEDALDENEMPRLEKESNQSYLFVRFVYTNADGEVDTAPLLFVFAEEVVLTVSLVRLPILDKFVSGKVDFATTQRAKLILQILHEIVDQYDVHISGISKKIKLIRSRLRGHGISNQDFANFVVIEDELNEFLSALQPTNTMFRRLLLGRHIPLFEDDQDLVEDLLLNNEQSIEVCSSNIKSIINIREAYGAISSNNLNRTMKILTVATVAIALPNLFYSMYGMNVPLPFQHERWAYALIMVFTITLTWLVFAMARRRRLI